MNPEENTLTRANAETCFTVHLDTMPIGDKARRLIELQIEERDLLNTALRIAERNKDNVEHPHDALTEAVRYIIYLNNIGHTLFRNEMYAIADLSIRAQLQSMEQQILTETLEETGSIEEFASALQKRVADEKARLDQLSEEQPIS